MLIWRRLILESTKILTNFVHVSRHCQEDNQQKVYIMMRWQDDETKLRKYFSQMSFTRFTEGIPFVSDQSPSWNKIFYYHGKFSIILLHCVMSHHLAHEVLERALTALLKTFTSTSKNKELEEKKLADGHWFIIFYCPGTL